MESKRTTLKDAVADAIISIGLQTIKNSQLNGCIRDFVIENYGEVSEYSIHKEWELMIDSGDVKVKWLKAQNNVKGCWVILSIGDIDIQSTKQGELFDA